MSLLQEAPVVQVVQEQAPDVTRTELQELQEPQPAQVRGAVQAAVAPAVAVAILQAAVSMHHRVAMVALVRQALRE